MDRQKNAEPKFYTKGCAILGKLWYYNFNFQEVCVMAAKKPFTENEQKLLKRSPYTYQVTAQEIYFTAEFKQMFWDLYRSGTSAVLAMRQLGYDTDLLGKERIRGIRTAVQRQALSPEGFRTGYKSYRKRRRPESIDALPTDQTLKRMQSEITYLRQEMEFLKSLSTRTAGAGGGSDHGNPRQQVSNQDRKSVV